MRILGLTSLYAVLLIYLTGCTPLQNEMAKEAFCKLAEGGKTEAETDLRSFRPDVRKLMESEDPSYAGIWEGRELSRDIAQRVVDACDFEGFERLKPELRPKDLPKK